MVAVMVVTSCSRADTPRQTSLDVGQWIWSVADSARFARASRSVAQLTPTVWIGSVHGTRDGTVATQLGVSPRISGRERTGVVVRFEDDFNAVWDQQSDSAVSASVGAALRSLLTVASTAGVEITEVQLDYDCPERLLPRWSAVVASMTRDPLRGRQVWLTSLVAHVRQRDYGDLFRAHVAGHILQVFDTGDRMSLSYADQIERLASRHEMPFRLGVAAFERSLANGNTTDHQAWFSAARVMQRSAWYRGLWVFPGGQEWASLMETAR